MIRLKFYLVIQPKVYHFRFPRFVLARFRLQMRRVFQSVSLLDSYYLSGGITCFYI